jgi:hypothetical protein
MQRDLVEDVAAARERDERVEQSNTVTAERYSQPE